MQQCRMYEAVAIVVHAIFHMIFDLVAVDQICEADTSLSSSQ
jgi:hypothetical protein